MGWNGYPAEGMVVMRFQLVPPRAGQPRASIQLRRGGRGPVETPGPPPGNSSKSAPATAASLQTPGRCQSLGSISLLRGNC